MTDTAAESEVLKTPLQTFTHPETKSVVLLFGMIHVAQPNYYAYIDTMLDEATSAGHAVHLEGVKKASDEELTRQSLYTRKKVQYLSRMVDGIYHWFDGTGLIMQKKALQSRPEGKNHDATMLEVARRTPLRSVASVALLISSVDKLMNVLEPDDRKKFVEQLMQGFVKRGIEQKEVKLARKILLGDMTPVILEYRNEIALRGVDGELAENPEKNISLVWGAAHLPGLGEGLLRRGYRQTDEEMLDAIRLLA